MRSTRLIPMITFAFLLASCSLFTPTAPAQVMLPTSGTPAPAAEVKFLVSAPAGTPADADLALVLLDPVTELDFNSQRVPLEAEGGGRWSTTLTPAVDTLLYYRYEMSSPQGAIEVTSQGAPVDFRTVYISGPGEIHEMIARWSGEPHAGETGRILGQIFSVQDDQPLNEMVVSGGGQITFTDGEGRFRLDGLPPGLHTLTVFSPTGSYRPQQQEAIVASNTSTPATLKLQPAEPVLVTFQVTVPSNTPEEATLRLAGNLAQLGFRFSRSNHGSFQSVAQMPALVRVDPEHYLGVFTLYAGTDLRYKYTLGDGIWNAERAANGSLTTRIAILKGENSTLRDTVEAWSQGSAEPTRFEVAIPDFTPDGDRVAIQFRVNNWRTPLPMWPRGSLWSFSLFGPESMLDEIEYRYCRNLQCNAADEAGFAGPGAAGRQLTNNQRGRLIQDVVDDWQWLDRSALSNADPSPLNEADYLTSGGVELLNDFDPSWLPYLPDAVADLKQMGANEMILTPAWGWARNNPFPVLELNPSKVPLNHELAELAQLARSNGMRIGIRPSFLADGSELENWWQQALRDQVWWDLWFEEYRSFILTYARWAGQHTVDRLIIGGPEISPALPFASLPDGRPSGVPVDSESRWRELISAIRAEYPGQLVFELEVKDGLSPTPPFLELFDSVHLFWHSPLADGQIDSQDVLLAEIEAQVNDVLREDALEEKPLTISLAYLSLENSAAACPQLPDGSCRPLSDLARGNVVDIDLPVDLQVQGQIYGAFLRAISDEPRIEGIFARGFYPAVILHDKSTSIYGKPAQDVLASWFAGLPHPE